MKGSVALLLCTVITAVAFSAPFPSEEEIEKWPHLIRDEHLSPHENANRLGFLSSLPRSSYIFRSFLASKDVLLQMIQGMDGVNKKSSKMSMSASSRNEARLQLVELLQDLLSSKTTSNINSFPASRSTEEYMVQMVASTREDKIEEQVDQLTRDFAEKCVAPFVHHITNFIKFSNNFGFNDPLLEKLLELTSNFLNIYINRGTRKDDGTFIDLFNHLINLIDGLSNANTGSVHSEQLSHTDRVVLDQLLRLFVTTVGNVLPSLNEREGTNSFKNTLGDLARFISGPLNSERMLQFFNNSVNFLLTQLDNPVLFTWGDNYGEAIKSFANSAMPVLFNNLRGLDSTREERMNLLKSLIKFPFAALNMETVDIDNVFQLLFSSEKSQEEINGELQPLLDLIFRNVSTVLKDVTNGGIFIDEEGCGGVAKEVIRLVFTHLPSLLDTDGDKRAIRLTRKY